MSLSRSIGLFKNIRSAVQLKNQVRHSGHDARWFYRDVTTNEVNKAQYLVADCLMGFTVWWILWWFYRDVTTNEVNKAQYLVADCLMGFTVWWILWHFWHEPGHVFGEFDYPDPTKWSDAELGIPPDDEE